MSMDLNLLPSQAKFQAKKNKLKLRVKKINYVLGGVWFLSLVGVFGWWKMAMVKLEEGQVKYKQILNSYELLQEEVVLNERMKYQAKLVGQVLGRRFEYGESIKKVTELFSDGVKLEDVNLASLNLFELGGVAEGIKGSDEIEEKVAMVNRGEIEGLLSAEIKSLAWEYNFWEFGLEVKTK